MIVTRRGARAALLLSTILPGFATPSLAEGGPENALLIVDPQSAEAMYVANYYKHARKIPNQNVLYISPGAANYQAFVDHNLPALFGHLANERIEDHIDLIVLPPGSPFFVSAPGYLFDQCFPVSRFSITSAYSTAFIRNEILNGGGSFPVTTTNRFFKASDVARTFDSSLSYANGDPNTGVAARRYFIAAMLGFTGTWGTGNSLGEILDNIDRSVAADGTRPAGTFYFMDNTADPLRNVRASQYNGVIASLTNKGAQAQKIVGILPNGKSDCLGIMTGAADLDFTSANLAIVPGAFGDHLTSWAATFDIGAQTKVAAWLQHGASGSWGAVEEPCNYTGKFPHARVHLYYYLGVTLAEAAFRAAQFFPFQMLLYGDPLTRPFAYIPTVNYLNPPSGPVSGNLLIQALAQTANPSAGIAGVEVWIDGIIRASTSGNGIVTTLDTTLLADGVHDLRIVAYENSLVRTVGHWTGQLTVNNLGRSAALAVSPQSGLLSQAFQCTVSAAGSDVSEVRLVQNGRVVAALAGSSGVLTVHGWTLGAGPATLQTEALYTDGSRVRSEPKTLDITFGTAGPSGQPATAFSFTKRVRHNRPFVVELPATYDGDFAGLSYTLLTNPSQATVPPAQSSAYRLMIPTAGASGTDSFTFRVDGPAGQSNVATVTLIYDNCPDLNHDRVVDQGDLGALLSVWGTTAGSPSFNPLADLNGDGTIGQADLGELLAGYGAVCSAP